MPYSVCCGSFTYMPDVDICPDCKQRCGWVYDEDLEKEHLDPETIENDAAHS
jgi:rubredoxin